MDKIELKIAKIIEETKKKTERLDQEVLTLQSRCPHNDVILVTSNLPAASDKCMFPVTIGNYYCKDCGLESIEKFGNENF